MSFKLVSPRLLAKFARASEDVTIVYELGLVGMYAASLSPYGGAGSSRWWRAITGTSGGPAQRSPRSPSGAWRHVRSTCSSPTAHPPGITWSRP